MGVAYLVDSLYICAMAKRKDTTGVDAAIQLKRAEVVRLRLLGYSYGDIVATRLYSSRGGARQAFLAALRDNYQEPTEAARFMEVARIEALIMANWDDATSSKWIKTRIEAGKYVLKLIARKCQILGIDAPQKVDIIGMLAPLAKPSGLNVEDIVAEIEGIVDTVQQAGQA